MKRPAQARQADAQFTQVSGGDLTEEARMKLDELDQRLFGGGAPAAGPLAASQMLGLSHEQWAMLPEQFRARVVLALGWNEAAHPRAPKGQANGGKFVAGSARQGDGGKAAAAQKNTGAADAADKLMKMSPAQRQAYLDSLSDDELKALSAYMYSFKSADPGVVAARFAIAGGLSRRGMNVNNYGGLGPRKPDGPRPAGAPPAGGSSKGAATAPAGGKGHAGGGAKGGGSKGGGGSTATRQATAAKHAAAQKAAADKKAAAQQKHDATAKAAADKRAAAAKTRAEKQKAAAQAKAQRQKTAAAKQAAAAKRRTQITGLRQKLAVTTDKAQRAALTVQIRRVAAGLPATGPVKIAASHVALASSSAMSGDGPSVTINADQRRAYAKSKIAMADGSFPIPDRAHLRKAVKAIGRADPSKRGAVRAHIRRRAKALGVAMPDAVK